MSFKDSLREILNSEPNKNIQISKILYLIEHSNHNDPEVIKFKEILVMNALNELKGISH